MCVIILRIATMKSPPPHVLLKLLWGSGMFHVSYLHSRTLYVHVAVPVVRA